MSSIGNRCLDLASLAGFNLDKLKENKERLLNNGVNISKRALLFIHFTVFVGKTMTLNYLKSALAPKFLEPQYLFCLSYQKKF